MNSKKEESEGKEKALKAGKNLERNLLKKTLWLEDAREAFDVFDVDGSGTIDHWLVAAGFDWGKGESMGLAYDVPQQGVQRVP